MFGIVRKRERKEQGGWMEIWMNISNVICFVKNEKKEGKENRVLISPSFGGKLKYTR